MILSAKLSYKLCFLVTDTGSQMVVAVESIDIAIDVKAVPEALKDVEQRDRIRTSGQTDYNNAAVKQSFAF